MRNPISEILRFNKEAGLLGNGMDSFKETAYILEEAIEGFEPAFNGQHKDGTSVLPSDSEWVSARQWSLSLMNQILQAFNARNIPMMSEVAEFDKALDGIVFNTGKLGKMRLTADQIQEGLLVVNDANMEKLGAPKDEHGKQLKPDGWTGPEVRLQAILDKRVA